MDFTTENFLLIDGIVTFIPYDTISQPIIFQWIQDEFMHLDWNQQEHLLYLEREFFPLIEDFVQLLVRDLE